MPYSWGDDTGETAESVPGGYDYSSARAAYSEAAAAKDSDADAGEADGEDRRSSYSVDHRAGKTPAPMGKELTTESTHPVVIMVDVTGSMSTWPGIIFEKLPLLGMEVERYFPDYAISFTAVGDAYCDSYPLQVTDFDRGPALDEHLKNLYPEGGGGDEPESYDLAAYYYVHHCTMDRALKPICILVCDAPSHLSLKATAIKKYVGDIVQSSLDSNAIFARLKEKFSFYVVLRGFCSGASTTDYWKKTAGDQRVLPFEEPRDIVEVLIGIIASEAGEFDDFKTRVSTRHVDKPDRVTRVMKSLKLIGAPTKLVDAKGTRASKKKSDSSGKSSGKGTSRKLI
jgi:hypothetical protein